MWWCESITRQFKIIQIWNASVQCQVEIELLRLCSARPIYCSVLRPTCSSEARTRSYTSLGTSVAPCPASCPASISKQPGSSVALRPGAPVGEVSPESRRFGFRSIPSNSDRYWSQAVSLQFVVGCVTIVVRIVWHSYILCVICMLCHSLFWSGLSARHEVQGWFVLVLSSARVREDLPSIEWICLPGAKHWRCRFSVSLHSILSILCFLFFLNEVLSRLPEDVLQFLLSFFIRDCAFHFVDWIFSCGC